MPFSSKKQARLCWLLYNKAKKSGKNPPGTVKSGREAQNGRLCLYTLRQKNARAKRRELHVAAQESKFSYDSQELYFFCIFVFH
jgi:hypothetical protein